MAGAPRSQPPDAPPPDAPSPGAGTARRGSRLGRLGRWIGVRAASVLLGLLPALLLAEGTLRIFGHEGPIYTFRDPEVGRRYTRSWSGEVFVEEAGAVVPVAFNREGLRDRDWPEERTAGALRVAVLGDSMVAGLASPAAERFTDLAAQAGLGADGAAGPWEVQNWGVAGSSPALALRLYEVRARRYRPDVVVLVWFEGNDLADDWQPLGGRRQAWVRVGPGGALEHVPLTEATSGLSEWLARHSRLYVWQKRVLAGLRGDDAPGALRAGLRALDVRGAPEVEAAWDLQARVLRRFARGVRADGAAPAVLHLPTPEAVADDLWAGTVEAARAEGWVPEREAAWRRLAALCAAEGLPAVSAAPALRAAAADPARRLFWGRRGHLDRDGHARVAEVLAALVRDARRLPAGPAPAPGGGAPR